MLLQELGSAQLLEFLTIEAPMVQFYKLGQDYITKLMKLQKYKMFIIVELELNK